MSSTIEYRFSDFLRAENIRCPLAARDWAGAVRELIGVLWDNEGGFVLEAAVADCLRRDGANSVGIAPGLALPHARVDDIDRVLVAAGIAPGGIEHPAPGRGPIHTIIAVLSPRGEPGLYLQTVAALSHDLRDAAARGRLAGCGSAYEVYEFFLEAGGRLPPYLLARDVMDADPPTVLENDDLRTVIETLCSQALLEVAVVDNEGDLRGAISLEDILRLSLPEHLLWMHDLSPLLRFEPFADLLRHDRERKAADVMRERVLTAPPDLPAVQVAKLFLTENTRQVLVTEGRRLLGAIGLRDFMSKLFWA